MSALSRAEFTRLGQSQRGLSVPATLPLDGSVQAPAANVSVLDARSEVARYWDWSPWAAAASWPPSAPAPPTVVVPLTGSGSPLRARQISSVLTILSQNSTPKESEGCTTSAAAATAQMSARPSGPG